MKWTVLIPLALIILWGTYFYQGLFSASLDMDVLKRSLESSRLRMTEDNFEDEAFIHDQMTDRKMLIGKVDGKFEFVAQRSERRKKQEKPTVCVKVKSDTVNINFASDTIDSEPSFDDDNFEIPQEKTSEQILIMP